MVFLPIRRDGGSPAGRWVRCNALRLLHPTCRGYAWSPRHCTGFCAPTLTDAERSACLLPRRDFCQSGGMATHLPGDGFRCNALRLLHPTCCGCAWSPRASHRIAPPILPDDEHSACLLPRRDFCPSGGMAAHLPGDGFRCNALRLLHPTCCGCAWPPRALHRMFRGGNLAGCRTICVPGAPAALSSSP